MYFDRGRILRELGEELDGEVSDSSTEIEDNVEEFGSVEIDIEQ
jgi:hypothetical protein